MPLALPHKPYTVVFQDSGYAVYVEEVEAVSEANAVEVACRWWAEEWLRSVAPGDLFRGADDTYFSPLAVVPGHKLGVVWDEAGGRWATTSLRAALALIGINERNGKRPKPSRVSA